MNTFIALFRGINVGGHNKLLMRELVEILDSLGLQNIETYIQSGNVVFDSAESRISILSENIQSAINQRHGFTPKVILLTPAEFENAIASNPFPEAENEPKTLHLYFLDFAPEKPDLKRLEGIKRDGERFALKGKVFYLHAPDGIGRSKLAVGVDKALGVTVTARNWRSVRKIMTMVYR